MMSCINSEMCVKRIVLQRPMQRGGINVPISILYQNNKGVAKVTTYVENTYNPHISGRDVFLSLEVTLAPLNIVPFKLEIEDSDSNVVFSFYGQWKNRVMKNIANISELSFQHPNLFINNGTDLTIAIYMGPLDQLNQRQAERKFIPPMEAFKVMLDNAILTDVLIITKAELFHCHKVILAASSEVFRAMFESKMKECMQNVVDFSEIYDASTIRDVLHYMYTKRTPPTIKKTATSLLVAAEYFQLSELKDSCVVILCEIIDVNTAAEILQMAEEYDVDVMKTKAVNFIADNYETVLETSSWKSIPDKMAKLLISTIFVVFGSQEIDE